ncbi:helix-turn-helix domain-containing protein [Streptomyces sp. NPDC032161]|uniref:AraC-like ligand-binding domain-containing protein n=1 Tax=unclassified Streptomyces TaxID=2593676 RepID=UPI0034033583
MPEERGPAGGRGTGTGSLVSMSSGELPRGDRFDWYVELVRENIAPFSLSSVHAHGFEAHVAAVELGSVQLTHLVFESLHATRTPRHIRRGDPETYQLALICGSPMGVSQCGNEAEVDTGSLVLFDTSHPLDACVPDERGQGRVTLLRIPRDALPLPAGRADRVLSRRLAADGVTGQVLRQYLTTVRDRAADLGAGERLRLGTIAVDLAAAFLAEHADARHPQSPESVRQVLRARIDSYMERNLGSADLTPAHVAAHHHMSLRSLHRLFRDRQETVAASIRRRRLERCHADLADPRLTEYPIAVLAARWGFPAPAEFSRAFRAAYGLSPRAFRHRAASADVPSTARPAK